MSDSSNDPPSEKSFVRYGSERIDFTVLRRNRKTLAITVHPDLSVEVAAPNSASEEAILQRVTKHARWILKQKRQFLSWMPKPTRREYRGGETHRYLGRQYRLKILKGTKPLVKLHGKFIEITLPARPGPQETRKALTQWYRTRAKERFQKQLQEAFSHLGAYQLPQPKLRLRQMNKRWGSCTSGGEIILNPDLVKAPSPCIEYVIVHELCHLRHPNHSRAFFQMLDAILPDWQKRKDRLERVEI